ncbi:amidohydrolase family protein [Bacillus sp. 3255]|uniref:amidohydrolase family protein n=1 Tax=Bacillus sp. 3255 TaxID=2817904 RepID=UPI0028676B09|nr:amidohydrolase family protein [Bacillus sp. 3255]MDR6883382.1 putative TIM-barrel fold metal-dependent hydrolase [Bacillus sp. 3255]
MSGSKWKGSSLVIVSIAILCVGFGVWGFRSFPARGGASQAATPENVTTGTPSASPAVGSFDELLQKYGSLPLADAHNHDASDSKYTSMGNTWKRDAVDRVVIFGDVSEFSAFRTDAYAWDAYLAKPDFYIPYFSGFDLHAPSSLEMVRNKLERGYFGLGEVAGASYNSPVVSTVEWKAMDPMDGYLPQIYELCAEYQAPILLHIDPPNGFVIDKLEEALKAHPKTTFIFGHANAYNSPQNIKSLLEKYDNIYMDFFAGFTLLNPDSGNKLEDFLPVIKQYPDKFMLSTDSGYGLASEHAAIEAMYRVLDAIGDPVIIKKVAYDNLNDIIRKEPATKTQKEAILKKDPSRDVANLSKLEAGKLLYAH